MEFAPKWAPVDWEAVHAIDASELLSEDMDSQVRLICKGARTWKINEDKPEASDPTSLRKLFELTQACMEYAYLRWEEKPVVKAPSPIVAHGPPLSNDELAAVAEDLVARITKMKATVQALNGGGSTAEEATSGPVKTKKEKEAGAGVVYHGGVQEVFLKNKKRLDPKDFMFSKLSYETLMKAPGEIAGQQFILEDLKECTVALLDHSDSITVDFCEDSKIVIGPSEGSVFIRNCTGCTFYVACGQLRTRECENCEIFLFVKTEPIIETSRLLKIAPWNVQYNELEDQLRAAGLHGANNLFSQVYDFSSGNEEIAEPHFTIVDEAPLLELDAARPLVLG